MTQVAIIKVLLAVALLTAGNRYTFAQTEYKDDNLTISIQSAFKSSIDCIASKAFLIASNNPRKATLLADSIINLSKQRGDDYGVAVGYNLKGNSFERRTLNDSAFLYYFKSLNLAEHKNFPAVISEALFNIGDLHEVSGRYDSAAVYIFSSLQIADSIHDRDLQGKNLRIVGNLMYKQNRFDVALHYYFSALQNFRVSNRFSSLMARTQENIALTYIKLDSNQLAEQYFQNASRVYEIQADERGKARVNLNLAMLRIKQKLTDEAIKRTTFALAFYKKVNHHNGLAECYMTLAEAYLAQKKYNEARQYATLLLSEIEQYEDHDLEQAGYKIMQRIYFAEGDFVKAYNYQSKSIALYTGIYNNSKDALITELLVRYNLKKAEHNARLLKQQNEINNLEIYKQKQQAMWLSLAIGMLLIILGLVFYILRIRQKQKVQQTRMRISSDLHDDLGSNLSKISLLAEVMKSHVKDTVEISELEKITKSTQEALEKMSEIVWSLNPKNDTLQSFISYIRKYTAEYFEPTTIECKINLPNQIPSVTLSGNVRRNVFLVVKEALHNIIKHAEANKVEMSISLKDHQLQIRIHDNGKGIDLIQSTSFGNGLTNMQHRMKESGGSFSIENNNGTTARLSLELN